MSKIKFGWSEVSLVPEGRKVNLVGQFYERITDEVLDPISVTALAIECGGEEAIFCACDLVSTSHILLESVRERLAKIDGFPVDKVMVSAIHTHTSLGYSKRSDSSAMSGNSLEVLTTLMPNAKYEKLVSYKGEDLLEGDEAHAFVADRIAKAAIEARANLEEGCYAQGFGRAAVGMCRRVCYDDGSAKMWGDTDMANFTELEGGNDSGIEMLFIYDKKKKLTGVIANVACPAQVLEHRNFISADYFGRVKLRLRERLGEDVNLLGIVSPAGDQCPRDLVRWVQPESPINDPNIVRNDPTVRVADPSMFDVSGCERAARRISDEIFYALEDVSEYVSETDLIHKHFMLDLPLRRVTIAEKDAAVKAIEEFAKEVGDGTITFADNARMHVHAGTVARYNAQQEIFNTTIEVHVLKLGNVAFATNPYELFLDYGNQMRARSKASQTFLIQLSCGSMGYLPTKKAEEGSHYSAYVSSGTVGHVGGDMLVRKTVSEINKMFK